MRTLEARLAISGNAGFLEPATSFVLSYLNHFGLNSENLYHFKTAFHSALSLILKSNVNEGLEIFCFEDQGKLAVEIFNHGTPFLVRVPDQSNVDSLSGFLGHSRNLDKVSVENLGRGGQKIVLETRLDRDALKKSSGIPCVPDKTAAIIDEEITIRGLQYGEEAALSRLFYKVYGYNYINEYVYFPEKIKRMIQEGRLISTVATLPDGRFVGHVGIVKWREAPPVYELALGVVDPEAKSKGLFERIFQKSMEKANETPMQFSFFDFVTNHIFSQRVIERFGTRDMAIFAGCQTKTTQASLEKLGVGQDPIDMDRYSILFSIIPGVKFPFGEEVSLPPNLGEDLGFLLKPLNVRWVPAPRFSALPPNGQYKTQFQPNQGSVIFDLFSPGRTAVESILKDWHDLLRNGYQYAAVEMPLDKPGIAGLYDLLGKNGFFISGFVPYNLSDKLGFRFQAVGPAKVAFDQIKVYSESGKRLLNLIKKDFERNFLI